MVEVCGSCEVADHQVEREGKELRSMDNRITWVLRKNSEGAWKIVHEHTSAPVDFETGKATLRR